MIYITGSSGFIGKSVLQELRDKKVRFKKVKVRKNLKKNILCLPKKKINIQNNILIHLGWGKMEDPWSSYHLTNNYNNSIFCSLAICILQH